MAEPLKVTPEFRAAFDQTDAALADSERKLLAGEFSAADFAALRAAFDNRDKALDDMKAAAEK